jgi:hypothetical protein
MDKLLKSPNSTHTECIVLSVVVLDALPEEVLEPRVVVTFLGGTLITITCKAANEGIL